MSSPVVLDSSFVVPLFLQERWTPDARLALASFGGETLMAPPLLHWEFANVLGKKQRAGLIDALAVDQFVLAFHGLGIEFVEAPTPERLVSLIGRAGADDLSGYDASYLDLAIEVGGELATFDDGLAKAAVAAGVALHGWSP